MLAVFQHLFYPLLEGQRSSATSTIDWEVVLDYSQQNQHFHIRGGKNPVTAGWFCCGNNSVGVGASLIAWTYVLSTQAAGAMQIHQEPSRVQIFFFKLFILSPYFLCPFNLVPSFPCPLPFFVIVITAGSTTAIFVTSFLSAGHWKYWFNTCPVCVSFLVPGFIGRQIGC